MTMPSFMRSTLKGLVCFLALAVAGYAVFAYTALPIGASVHPDMRANFIAHSTAIYTHIFASVIALVLGPFQFHARLRNTHRFLHRLTGRIYLGIGVLVGGLSGLYISTFAFGGVAAKLGFAALAVCWLYSGARAITAIRRGAVDEHRRWMTRNFALTLAAVSLRIYLPISMISGIPFETAYPVIAWLAWVPNLLLAEWIVSRSCNTSTAPMPMLAAG